MNRGALNGWTLNGPIGATALYLPYEFNSVLIETGNANAFGIDPEATTLITVGLTAAD